MKTNYFTCIKNLDLPLNGSDALFFKEGEIYEQIDRSMYSIALRSEQERSTPLTLKQIREFFRAVRYK